MARFLSRFVLPMLLLIAASLDWSFISLVDLLAFLFIQYIATGKGARFHRQSLISRYVLILPSLTLLSHAVFRVVIAVEGDWRTANDAHWALLIGFGRVQSWRALPFACFLVTHLLAIFVSLVDIYGTRFGPNAWREFHYGHLSSSVLMIGCRLRALCFFLLPAVQLIVGISHPSWVSLPFFIFSSIGLVHWSLTRNFFGLLQWWKYRLSYAALNIILLYIYQLPIEFPENLRGIFYIIGLFKISIKSEWPEVCSGLSVLLFYIMLCWIRCDLAEMNLITSRESTLTEQLLPQKHYFSIHESRYGARQANFLLQGADSQSFRINVLTYGFPISLLALSFWSFHFASLCAMGLLAYDMEIWETIGLSHYLVPGHYLLAQFGLGILIAMCNIVSSSVLLCLTDGEGPSKSDDFTMEEKETTVLFVATIAWGVRKSSHAAVLILIFLIAMRPGLIQAVYMLFFLIYLLSRTISWKLSQTMILLGEAHFALQYILQLNLISKTLEEKDSLTVQILSQLGLLDHINSADCLKILILACFCAIHNHGLQAFVSFSVIVQHTSCPPIGFNILRAGLIQPALTSVDTPRFSNSQGTNEKMISYLNAIGQNFLSVYRSCGKYIAFLTILLSVNLVPPNYASFGYLFFLLLWVSGRQLLGQTRRYLWYPMKVYAVTVFVSIYSIAVLSSSKMWSSRIVDLQTAFGYNPAASMLKNIWESLAVLVVMQLYSYERRQSRTVGSSAYHAPKVGAFAFARRLLICHVEKILSLALFYASLSPISAFGFLYLVGLILSSRLPKSSQIPAELFLVYSGLLVMVEYLFQLWGNQAKMFPGQEHAQLSLFLGLQLYKPGFTGLESGLRGKIVVIIACILQYNVFRWLEKMPRTNENGGSWDESCSLFRFAEMSSATTSCSTQNRQSEDAKSPSKKRRGMRSYSCPSLNSAVSQGPKSGLERDSARKYRFWENSRDILKWNRKRIIYLRKERFEMQKTFLEVSLKFWIENVFPLFGLEITMIALLLASFAVLNAVSLLYIASLAACILLHRLVIQRLWPMFVFLFAAVMTVEYLAIWRNFGS